MTLPHCKCNACDRLRMFLICWVITSLLGSSKMFQHKLLTVVSVQSILNAGNKLKFLCIWLGLKNGLIFGYDSSKCRRKVRNYPFCKPPLQNNHDEQSNYVMFDKRTIDTRSLVSSPILGNGKQHSACHWCILFIPKNSWFLFHQNFNFPICLCSRGP